MKRLALLLVFVTLLSSPARAANHYILAAAAGSNNGNDWTNAWTTVTGRTWVRGDVYYLGKGTYTGGVTFSTTPSGVLDITINGATVADHGTATGWSDNFSVEAGEAFINGGLDFTVIHLVIDGKIGGSSVALPCTTLSCWTSGYGIRIKESAAGAPVLMGESACGNVTLSHVNVEGNHGDGAAGGAGNDGLQMFTCTGGDKTITLTSSYVHDTGRCLFYVNGVANHLIIDHTATGLNESDPNEHSEMTVVHATSDFVFRYGLFLAVDAGGTGAIVAGDDCNNCHYEVYGNVFYDATGVDWGSSNNGFITADSSAVMSGSLVYNNTFVNVNVNQIMTCPGTGPGSCSANLAKNNYFYLTTNHSAAGWGTQSFDHFQNSGAATGTSGTTGTGNPFTSYTTGDFSLLAATTAGTTLGASYTTDMFGRTRGADGTWDRGAVEFCTGGCGGGGGGGGATTKSRIRFKRYAPDRQGDDDEGETHGVYRSLQAAPRGDAAGAHRRVRAHGWVLRVAAPVRPSEPAHDGRVGAGRGQDDRRPAEARHRVGEVEGDPRASRRGTRKVACAARTARAYSAA